MFIHCQVNGDNRGRVLSVVLQAVPYSNNDNSSRPLSEINRIYDGVEAETKETSGSFSDYSSLILGREVFRFFKSHPRLCRG